MNQKKAKEIADDLGGLYQQVLDSYEIGDFYAHFRAEIKILKKMREHHTLGAPSAEKIAALEAAVAEFDAIYQAELAEAQKMPLSWHEARRVLKLFEEAEDPFTKIDTARPEH